MASSAFRSTTRRTSVFSGAREVSGSSNRSGAAARRSRSLSRFSGRFPPPPPPPEADEFATPRGRFVNKARGAGFPEISLDDLADEFFRARVESEEESEPSVVARSSRGHSGAKYSLETESSRHRGRSVSRVPDRRAAAQGKGFSDSTSRRRRSISIARQGIGGRYSESEIDIDLQSFDNRVEGRTFSNRKSQQPLSHKPSSNSYLKRSTGQNDLFLSHDNYSSHSSVTDDETDPVSSKHGIEKTTQPNQSIGDTEGIQLYEAMCKGVRDAVEEIRVELEKVMVKTEPKVILGGNIVEPKSSNVLEAITQIRRNYTAKLEESEKRKQDLLAKLALEEERGQELSKIVKELLPSPKKSIAHERSACSTRRSNDRTRISKRLTEEAERYFEDFLSNVEDTDISSFDGERSDSGSTMKDQGLLRKDTPESISKVVSTQLEADGVLLPWLHWETSNDSSSPCNTKAGVQLDASPAQEASASLVSDNFASSFGSWSPGCNESSSSVTTSGENGNKVMVGKQTSISANGKRDRSFDMDEYLKLQRSEDLLFETARQRQRIESGGLILCGRYLL